jgi:hypothetical protein
LQDYRSNLILKISKLIDDEQFKSRNTNGSKGFSRNRRLGFNILILLISRSMLSSVQRELNSFFSKVQGLQYSLQAVTKGALTQARAKLKPEAFVEMNQVAVNEFYEGAPYQVWKTHRLLAIDGSTLNLPSHATTRKVFGEMCVGCKADVKRSMGRISVCYDVLNLLTLDARIDRFDVSEKALLKEHLNNVFFKKGDIVLADRGYPSIALMYILKQKGVEFCFRMKDSWWKEVEKFVASGHQSKEVVFELPKKDKHLQNEWQCKENHVRCRLVLIELDNGEKEILCTSLLNDKVYTIADLKALYHYRWNVEEGYKLFKCRAQLEVFSGKTANAIKQDFYAKIFMMTTCAVLSFPIDKKVREETINERRKHAHQINRTNALSFCREAWVTIWLKKQKKKILAALDTILSKTTDIVRPGRNFIRKKRPKYPPTMTYKQL